MGVLLVIISLTAAAPDVEIHTLEGQTVIGPIVELDADRVTIDAPEGRVSFDTEKLIRLSLRREAEAPVPESAVRVELVDGSSLAAVQYTVHDGRARITLRGDQVVELPTAGVSSVRLQTQSEAVTQDWTRIANMKVDGDLLVVRKGEVIDYHKGVLRDVTDEVVQFELDGELLPVKRAKVHGLVYCHPQSDPLPEAVCRVADVTGSQWSVRSIALSSDLEWTTPAGLTVVRPLATVTQIDFSRGKVVFLSDLKPESITFTPWFGGNEDAPLLTEFYAPREDKHLGSGLLQLGGRQYGKGLWMHSRSRVVYRLPGRFRRLKAVVGIDDRVRPRGHVRLVIRGDDRVLLETTAAGTDPPRPVDLDVSGVRRITLLVDFGDQLDVADHLDLCEARIIK